MQPTKHAFRFAFGPYNYRLMWVGLALLAAGFITMMFGDKANYGEDFVGITLGPLLLLAGFAVEFAAIMVRDKSLEPAPVAPITASGLTTDAAPAANVPTTPAPAAPAYKRL
ncbi:DUF3098 domain-containing protein [Hymenobacter negativus]|uniref:DUF3098 domain-containing protein n=1 Tax=Hymenobacter negativus TaxID=2795026 RepID=A0ABS3QN57_9BACT|nr:DUF3098 domain-containing protein [Hymenobacter negativus]MBO2012718.1 DUF3098 domain-containing protein [Hymenobacter negativus]